MEFIFALIGYLIGTIPFGLLLTKAAGLGDIRTIGSGNIGATNVLRTGNKKLAAATLFLDGAKGAVAVLLAKYFANDDAALMAGLFSIIGHVFPIWLNFKGGKGVATTLGMLLALAPFTGLAACGIWLLMAAVFRYSSLSALIALLSTPLTSLLIYHDPRLSLVCAVVCALVWYTHRANIKRLLKGEEPKIGKKT
ncbi:MAG: glycerol-3-phosphate 1-O-acyltransferase PlsY [Micavibrio sp.]